MHVNFAKIQRCSAMNIVFFFRVWFNWMNLSSRIHSTESSQMRFCYLLPVFHITHNRIFFFFFFVFRKGIFYCHFDCSFFHVFILHVLNWSSANAFEIVCCTKMFLSAAFIFYFFFLMQRTMNNLFVQQVNMRTKKKKWN